MNLHAMTRIATDEDGGAYTLSYVMVVPFVMLFMCLIVETTLMLTAKVGTVHAAFVGARVATVWSSATDWQSAEERIEQAAVKAFVPFASGSSDGDVANSQPPSMDRFLASYQAYAEDPVSAAYVRKKYQNAASKVSVRTDGPPSTWDANVTVTVTYESPFRVPGIGRLLGEDGGNGRYYFPLETSVTLRNDGPQNARQDLGIGYGKLD